MHTLVLYGKAGCHLCEEMEEVVERVRRDVPFALEVVDVTDDPTLLRLYGHDVPVLTIDGRAAFKHRVEALALRQRLGTS